jgi:glycosyltransferase involved in cell wall biosynthesis
MESLDNVKKHPDFSVSMSVYINDDSSHFKESLMSLVNQTVKPSEIVLVIDGPVNQSTHNVIDEFKKIYPNLILIELTENMGHAISRQHGIQSSSYNLVALMDSDDISVSDRFEKQLKAFNIHPEIDVLGGQINEFIDFQENIVGVRNVPLNDIDIKNYLKKRCPFNQMTVMIKKSSMQEVGGYLDWYCNEDYYLWVRMFLNSSNFRNLNDVLVNVRVGNDMYARRGGLKYFLSEMKLQKLLLKHRIISYGLFMHNVIVRFIVQLLMPSKLRGLIFQFFFRK